METKKEMYKRNLLVVEENKTKIEAIKKEKATKLNRLAIYMLGGKPVKGRTMINKFRILSYRDAIYDLKKKGYEINAKTIYGDNGVSHVVWWMSCYDEEFVMMREEIFLRFF